MVFSMSLGCRCDIHAGLAVMLLLVLLLAGACAIQTDPPLADGTVQDADAATLDQLLDVADADSRTSDTGHADGGPDADGQALAPQCEEAQKAALDLGCFPQQCWEYDWDCVKTCYETEFLGYCSKPGVPHHGCGECDIKCRIGRRCIKGPLLP